MHVSHSGQKVPFFLPSRASIAVILSLSAGKRRARIDMWPLAVSSVALVVTNSTQTFSPVFLQSRIKSAAARLAGSQSMERPLHRSFVIGGAHVYNAVLALPPTSDTFVDRILLTRILSPAFEDCDVFFPDFLADNGTDGNGRSWKRASFEELKEWAGFDVPEGIQEENGVQYEFQMWVR